MPRKIKTIWVLCCICIFLGFSFLSAKNQIQENRQRNEETIEKNKEAARENKKSQELKVQFNEIMGKVQELNALRNYDQAAEMASKAVKLDPKNAKAYTWWGRSLANAGKIREAHEKFDQSSRLDPNQSKNYYYWGLALMLEGKMRKQLISSKTPYCWTLKTVWPMPLGERP